MSLCFCWRDIRLTAYSRLQASLRSSWISLYASMTGRRPRVYLAPTPELCSKTLRSRSLVIPV